MSLRTKIVTVLLVFIVFFGIGVYPILASRYALPGPQWLLARQLKLGLDLKGGVHLVLRVQTDDALRVETEQEMSRLQAEMKTRGIPATATPGDATHFKVDGVPPAQDQTFRQAAAQEAVNFERGSGVNGSYGFAMRPSVAQTLREEAVVQARQTIERRVNELGVTEPSIAQQGADQILVQLPGVADVDRAKEIIGSPGMLELKLVEQGPAATKDDLLRATGGVVPPDMELLSGAPDPSAGPGGAVSFYLVRRVASVTGHDLRSSRSELDENNQPAVGFTLNREGAAAFGRVTGENIGKHLAIVLDKIVQSAPRIEGRINDSGRIHGSFTQQEAADLSLILRSGALPATLTYLEERTIGPSLGADSIRSGILASAIGLISISIFMLVYYRLSGVNAIIALIFNLVILLGLMAYVGAVMTLPGIAGFVLTMGIGVDSNVLIFERIKEELEAQHGVRASINAGFNRVFWTLFDTHTAALISAAFLFQFGTGPIRGFAVTLVFGLMSNLFTSIFVSKTLFEFELSQRRVAEIFDLAMHIFHNTNFNFLRWRWHAIALSWVVIIAGVVMIATKGIPRGVEFAGGTVVIEQFDQPVSVEQVRTALDRNYAAGGQNSVVQAYGDPALRQVMIRVPQVGAESGASLSTTAALVEDALRKGNLGAFRRQGAEIVSATVGRELETKGLYATVFSLIGLLIYLGARFQLSFGVGAVIATIHDLLITLAFLAFFRYDMSLNVIAAILTITGFSTNDTIVIFDRIRENLRVMRRDNLDHVINASINQTLGRTVITSGTALLTAVALFFFGGEVLHGFAFTMVVGIITGTYSSVFIAAAVVSFWRGQGPARAAAHAPGSAAAPAPPAGRTKQRKARAS